MALTHPANPICAAIITDRARKVQWTTRYVGGLWIELVKELFKMFAAIVGSLRTLYWPYRNLATS